MAVRIVAAVFEGRGRPGDFAWMIDRPEYADALFLFNDNEEQFRAFHSGARTPSACSAGGGNAVIRPWQCALPPRAAGIPTGTLAGGGYAELTDSVRQLIDSAVGHIRSVVEAQDYRRVFYSAADDSGALGTGIFRVDDGVRDYVVAQLRRLAG